MVVLVMWNLKNGFNLPFLQRHSELDYLGRVVLLPLSTPFQPLSTALGFPPFSRMLYSCHMILGQLLYILYDVLLGPGAEPAIAFQTTSLTSAAADKTDHSVQGVH